MLEREKNVFFSLLFSFLTKNVSQKKKKRKKKKTDNIPRDPYTAPVYH